MIFYTGITRRAGDILEVQKAETIKKLEVLRTMKDLCADLIETLRTSRSLNDFGEILHQGWLLKKSLVQEISNDMINDYYEKARSAGAIGGKLLGAGGGGFLLFYVEPQNQDRVRQALSTLTELPFQFEPQGSKVIYISD
jgi:D-glycero-alpha-D-manno-heptose-7-phosphate kinase